MRDRFNPCQGSLGNHQELEYIKMKQEPVPVFFGKVIDRAELAGILGKLDMTDAYRAFGCVLVDDLGLPASEFPFVLDEDDRKWHDKILHDVFEGGNFGANRHHTEDSWKYKMETMGIAFRNSFRYYRLCPSEVGGMIPRLVKVNLKLLFSRTEGRVPR